MLQLIKTENFIEENDKWLNSFEAAEYLRISVGALRNMTCNGRLPFYKLGRRNRYLLSDLRNTIMSERRGRIYGN